MKNIVDKHLNKCSRDFCLKFYKKRKTEINKRLEKYKHLLPLLFVHDLPTLNNNTFADIINNDVFEGMCSDCCWHIVQSYNFNEKTLLERYFTNPGKFSKQSLCYN